MPDTPACERNPLVHQEITDVTSGNECYALDAGTGRQIWHYRRESTKRQGPGESRCGAGGGPRSYGQRRCPPDRTQRLHGRVFWFTVMADYRENYFATWA